MINEKNNPHQQYEEYVKYLIAYGYPLRHDVGPEKNLIFFSFQHSHHSVVGN